MDYNAQLALEKSARNGVAATAVLVMLHELDQNGLRCSLSKVQFGRGRDRRHHRASDDLCPSCLLPWHATSLACALTPSGYQ